MAADTARPHPAPGDIVVVMGVSASGKSTVARALAHELRASFLDGDDFHAPASRSHMAAGRPLGDAEREGWLAMLAARLAQAHGSGEGVVLACSAGLPPLIRSFNRAYVVGARTPTPTTAASRNQTRPGTLRGCLV